MLEEVYIWPVLIFFTGLLFFHYYRVLNLWYHIRKEVAIVDIPKMKGYELRGTKDVVFWIVLIVIQILNYMITGHLITALFILTILLLLPALFMRFHLAKFPKMITKKGFITKNKFIPWERVEWFYIRTINPKEISVLHIKTNEKTVIEEDYSIYIPTKLAERINQELFKLGIKFKT